VIAYGRLGAFPLCLAMAMILSLEAAADDEAKSTPANELTIRCLLLARAESSFPPSSAQQSLEAHQVRMRTICWDWRALTASASLERKTKASALLERCLSEAPFDLARAHELYYERHVKSVEQMCRDFGALAGESNP
jgi:hypothetical protein